MGHEAFGVIDTLGSDVPSERLGQTVVIEPNVACFACGQCKRGWTSACIERESVGMNRPGALADYLVVPSPFAWSIPALPANDLVCVEPATVVMAALRRLKTPLPDAALVVGVGAQGLTMSLALMERDVSVYTYDLNPERVAFTAELGASPTPADVERGFTLVVDTVGSPGSMAVALENSEVGATVLCLGLDSRPLDLDARTLVRKQLTLQGSLTYDHPGDFESTIALLSDGLFAPGRIVTDEYPLDESQLAFENGRSSRGKTWISVAGQAN
jgi:alcohol dehydrogenase/L-iditol 2-dehydrogenase